MCSAMCSIRSRLEITARTQVDRQSLNHPVPLNFQLLVAHSRWDSKAHGWEDDFAIFSMLLPCYSVTIPRCYFIP